MKLSDFDYYLPKELIAQEPIRPRDHSRLLYLDRKTGKTEHKHFYDIVDYLEKGDVLVMNNSKVFPARLIGKRAETGGKIEIFLLRRITPPALRQAQGTPRIRGDFFEEWQCLVGGRRRNEGLEVRIGRSLKAILKKDLGDGTWEVEFDKHGDVFMDIIERIGQVPLPPYI